MKPPRSKLRGITRKGIVCETPRFLTLFPLELSALWADSSHLCARRFPNGVLTPPGLPAPAVSGALSHPRPLQRLGGFLGMDHTAHA